MHEIYKLLELENLPDFEITSGGASALKPEGHARTNARDVRVNAPLETKHYAELAKWIAPIPEHFIMRLFKMTNGIRVKGNKFVTYGLLDEKGGAQYVSVPLDIDVPNVYERPKGIADSSLIVGAGSYKSNLSDRQIEVLHLATVDEEIHVIESENVNSKLETYKSVDDWLVAEFRTGLKNQSMWEHLRHRF